MKQLLLFISLSTLLTTYSLGQVFSIADGNISSCNGVIHDTGGAGGAGYSNNESFTLTVCSNDPNKQLVLDIQNLILDPTVGAGGPGAVDNIQIFDGNTATGTPVYTAQGTTVNGYLITPSPSNTSGCLTIVFNSNEVGTGSFTLSAVCEFPCVPPTAVATSNPSTIARICKGDVVTFDGSGSTAQAGFNIDMYYWDYDDGNPEDSVSGATTSYQFNNEGAYRVKLRVRDNNPDNRCFNTNAVEMVVLVAPDPIFQPMEIGGPVCLGESATLTAHPDQYAQTWTGAPYANLGGPQFIPDQVGSCFSSTITYGVFSPGQQLTNINDLLGITVNMEHSYMGDLQISIICPTGQSVMLHNQGGGGTYLGIPVDNDSDNSPGTGWDYTWSPTATNGTWVDNAGFGITSLPSGTYESLNPLSGLVGCDLNGTWQIQVCDLLGSDNGFIFNWGIDFDPSLFPGVGAFTPIIGLQSDSSTWTATADGTISPNGDVLTVTPTTTGNHTYTYTVTDNHGCTNDTTVTITVTPNPVVSITGGPNAVACANADFQLNANVSPNPGAVVYNWTPATDLSDPNISNPVATVSGTVTYEVKAYKTGHPLCYTTDQITLTVTPPPPAGQDVSTQYCKTDPAVDMFTLLNGSTPGGTWIDAGTGNVAPQIFNPSMQDSTTFVYEVIDANGCRDTAVVIMDVAKPFVLHRSNDTTICQNGTAVLSVNPTGGFGAPFTETWTQGLTGNGPHSVTPTADQCYDVFVTDQHGCTSQTETICVNLRPPLTITTSGDATICLNTNTLLQTTNVGGGNDGHYSYEWKEGNNVLATINQVNVSPTTPTQYCVTVSDNCETTPVTECVNVDLFPQPTAQFTADKVDGCYPIQVTFTNDTDPSLVSSALWVFGNGTTSTQLNNVTTIYGAPICYDVQLTVTSPDGCVDDTIMANYICPFDYPEADFNIDPNPTTFFHTNIEVTDLSSSDVVSYDWDFGTTANPPTSTNQNNLVRFPSETIGQYPIFLTVTNADGCQDTLTKVLIINSVFTLYVPNAFSPNDDGENDTFFIKGESISADGFNLKIFDRDGHIVFETTDKNAVWNGTSKNGTPLKQGAYIWKIEAKDIYSNDVRKSIGHVTIIR